jgi:hypothetical protein
MTVPAMANVRPWFIISQKTFDGVAPSAIRVATSPVRWADAYEIAPVDANGRKNQRCDRKQNRQHHPEALPRERGRHDVGHCA